MRLAKHFVAKSLMKSIIQEHKNVIIYFSYDTIPSLQFEFSCLKRKDFVIYMQHCYDCYFTNTSV